MKRRFFIVCSSRSSSETLNDLLSNTFYKGFRFTEIQTKELNYYVCGVILDEEEQLSILFNLCVMVAAIYHDEFFKLFGRKEASRFFRTIEPIEGHTTSFR